MKSRIDHETEAESTSFADAATAALQRIRAALLGIFEMQGGIARSRDAQERFGINAKLSWQLFRLAAPGAPLSLAPHVPSAVAMQAFHTALARRHVAAPLIAELKEAHGAFETLVSIHAGDRSTFESMVRALSGADVERGDLQHRKAMFRACSHYWGVQCDTYFTFGVLHPASNGLFDYAHVRARLGLRRLRQDASCIVDSFKLSAPGDGQADAFARESLDENSIAFGAPILSQFSTRPLPQFRTMTDPDGTSYSELVNDTVGRRGAVNMVFGQVSRNSPLSPGSDGSGQGFGANVRITIPTTHLVTDMLVHRPTFPRLNPFLKVYGSNLRDNVTEMDRRAIVLPFNEKVQLLDGGPRNAWTREIPNYADIVSYVTVRLGWPLDDFDVYRVTIEYPLMHTRVAMGFDIPKQS